MADFFSDVFDAFTGQQSTPQQTIIGTNDLLGQTGQLLTSQIAPQTIAYNQMLAPALTDVQLGVERQYNPYAFDLRSSTTKSILDNLGLGTSLPPEIQDLVVKNALEGSAASGFGVSQGGRGLVARDLGLTGLDLARSRRQEALGAVNSSPSLNSLYNPSSPYGETPGFALASDIRDVQAAKDDFENLKEDIRKQNFSNLLSTGFRIAGGVVGGIFGGAAGAQMGQQAGGAVIQGSSVRGVKRADASGGGFGSILSGLFGGGGAGGGGLGGNTTGDFPSGYGSGASGYV